jgi:hypothetical protein
MRIEFDSDKTRFLRSCLKERDTLLFPTKYNPCSLLCSTRPFAIDMIEFSYGMINFGQPLGAARLASDGGIPISLSNTQRNWMYGFNSSRISTKDTFIRTGPALTGKPARDVLHIGFSIGQSLRVFQDRRTRRLGNE